MHFLPSISSLEFLLYMSQEKKNRIKGSEIKSVCTSKHSNDLKPLFDVFKSNALTSEILKHNVEVMKVWIRVLKL